MLFQSRVFLIGLIVIISIAQTSAQARCAGLRQKEQWLTGQWQLVKTMVAGKAHRINKSEYDCIVSLNADNTYTEEVKYESSRWIIAGQWQLSPADSTLALTDRHYISGSQGDKLVNINFKILAMGATQWAGSSITKSESVTMYYAKVQH